jgi:lipoprotein NlpI
MRKSVFVLGALFLSCGPSYGRCPNAACSVVAERCNATDKAYTKQIVDASHAIAGGADATGPEGTKSIAAADAALQLWQSGDCAVMMNWAKVPGLADQIAKETNEAALARVARAAAYSTKGEFDSAIADYSEAIRLTPIIAIPRTNNKLDVYSNRGIAYHSKGDINRAMADYDEAIRLNARSLSAYLNRGRLNLYTGGLPKALADFSQASALDPKYAYAALWLDIAGQRSGIPSRLPQAVGQIDMTAWPAPVIQMFVGQLTPAAVLAAADNPNPKTKQGQVCEANFYGGELALRSAAIADATRLFRLAASDCPKGFAERESADAELKALGIAQ